MNLRPNDGNDSKTLVYKASRLHAAFVLVFPYFAIYDIMQIIGRI